MTRNEKLIAAQTALLEGNLVQAESLYHDLLCEEPGNIHALDGMGVLCCRIEDSQKGIAFFKEGLRRLLAHAESFQYATDSIHSVEELERCQATMQFHLGLALRAVGNTEEAIHAFRESFELAPENTDPLLNLGQMYFEQGRRQEALVCFRALTDLQPQNASAWLTYGYLLSIQENDARAIEPFRKAFQLDPTSSDACFFLAESLRKTQRYEESLPYYRQLLQVAAERPQTVVSYGKSLLALGNFEDGWDAMEFRLTGSFGTWERHLLPNWDGTPRKSQNVLAYSEENIASDIMFASCIPDLIHQVEHCVVECDESLHTLFRRSFPRATIVPLTGEIVGETDERDGKIKNSWGISLDCQIALGSLPRFFRRKRSDFPLRKVYFVADDKKVDRWMNRLTEHGTAAKIGFLWQGSWTSESEKQVTLPLIDLQKLMSRHVDDATWICLQDNARQTEWDQFLRTPPLLIHRYPEIFQFDLDEMAGLLSALDLVITPPGYIAHLAGALGVETWLILPSGADWRWSLGNRETLWHPSLQAYRQQVDQSWPDLFHHLEDDLQRFLTWYHPPKETPLITIPFPEEAQKTVRRRKAG